MEQKQPKQTEKDELLDMVIEQKEETATSQDSDRETKPRRIIRVNPDQEKTTIHVTK